MAQLTASSLVTLPAADEALPEAMPRARSARPVSSVSGAAESIHQIKGVTASLAVDVLECQFALADPAKPAHDLHGQASRVAERLLQLDELIGGKVYTSPSHDTIESATQAALDQLTASGQGVSGQENAVAEQGEAGSAGHLAQELLI